MAEIKSRFWLIVKACLLSVLGFLMPMHGKRIMLVTTLHLQLVRDGIFREETLEKLNSALRLARFDDALVLPATVYSSVWDDNKLQQAIHSVIQGDLQHRSLGFDEAKRLSESVLAVTPKWLQYGRREDMMKDLINLFYSQTSANAQPA